jgi:CheY-like chemotaxis protein
MSVILTVEDETLLSVYLGGVLEDAGYQVVAAANADEAIEILEARSEAADKNYHRRRKGCAAAGGDANG